MGVDCGGPGGHELVDAGPAADVEVLPAAVRGDCVVAFFCEVALSSVSITPPHVQIIQEPLHAVLCMQEQDAYKKQTMCVKYAP